MKLFQKIALFKNYLGRAGSWMTMINFFLIVMTWKQVYGLQIPAWMIVTGGILAFVVIGALDFKYIMPHQLAHQDGRHRMAKQVEEIRGMIKDGKTDRSELDKDYQVENSLGKTQVPVEREQEA